MNREVFSVTILGPWNRFSVSSNVPIVRNASWAMTGNGIYAACQWGVVAVLARIGDPEMVGRFAFALAITAPMFVFSNLQLRAMQATDATREYRFNDYLTLRVIMTVLSLAVILVVLLMGSYSLTSSITILLIALAKGADAISDIFYGLFQQHEQLHRVSKALIINGLLSVFFLGLGAYLTGSLAVGVLGYALASLITLVIYVVPSGIFVTAQNSVSVGTIALRWSRTTLLGLLRTTLPLGLVMLIISLNTNVPRYFIEASLGKRELGIFAALAYLTVVGHTIMSALGQAVSPRLALCLVQRRFDRFTALLRKLVAFGLATGIIAALLVLTAGVEVTKALYGEEYSNHNNVMLILAVAAGLSFGSLFLGYGLIATRYFDAQIPVFVFVLTVTFGTSTFLIPAYGLMGAAFVVLVTAFVQLTLSMAVIRIALRRIWSSSDSKVSEPRLAEGARNVRT